MNLERTMIDQVWPKTQKWQVSNTKIYFLIPDQILFLPSYSLSLAVILWLASGREKMIMNFDHEGKKVEKEEQKKYEGKNKIWSGMLKKYPMVSEMCHFRVLGETRGRCKQFTNSRICGECVRTISCFVQTATTGLQQRRSSANNTTQICSKIPPHYCSLFFSFSFLKIWDSSQIAFHLNRKCRGIRGLWI